MKTNRPYFSILTATLNQSSTIKNNLESICNQRFKNLEHIVADGGSTDNTLEIINKYGYRYHLYWISEPDGGIADALNKALRMATGKYILVLQADDALLNDATLEFVHAFIKKSEKDICSFPVLLDRPSRSVVLRKPIRHIWYNRFRLIFPHQGCFVRRRVFDNIGGFNTSFRISMDYDFFYRALKHKYSIEFFSKPVSIMGDSGISSVVDNVPHRLLEDQLVQAIHEDNKFWKTIQKLFWIIYLPYKIRQMKKTPAIY